MCLRSVDWDDKLSYETVKVVRVRDAKLGLLRLIFLALIFAYIFIKVIWMDASYNIHDTPTGAVRISLEFPKKTVELAKEPFCPQHPNHKDWGYETELTYACQVWDEHNIRYPADELNSIFITTRAHIQEQQYHCGQANTPDEPDEEQDCETPFQPIDGKEYTVFLAGARDFTLGIQHSFYSPQFNTPRWSGNSRALFGKLVDTKNKVVKTFPPPDPKHDNPELFDIPDIISLNQLLEASDTDLYQASKDPGNSQYYSGVVLMVLVRYENSGKKISYTYKAKQIPNADYKLFEARWVGGNQSKDSRTVIKRAGVKTIFLITGDFAQFDFQTLLIQFVSAVGLLSLSTLVVEFIMLNIMKFRRYYRKAKYDETENFSSLYTTTSGEGMDSADHTSIDTFNTQLLPNEHQETP